LVASWPLAWVAGHIGARMGPTFGAKPMPAPALTFPVDDDEEAHFVPVAWVDPQLRALCDAQASLAKSLFLPLIGVGLLLPLSLHLLVAVVIGAFSWIGFGLYMAISAITLLPAYGVLIRQCIRYGRSLAGMSAEPVLDQPGGHALAVTFLASFVPGIMLMGVPPVLVAVTGALFIPAMFAVARATYHREALSIRAHEQALVEGDSEVVLQSLRAALLRIDVDLATQVTAFRILSGNYEREVVGPIVDEVLGQGRIELLMPALGLCRELNHRPPVGALVGLAQRFSPEAAAAAVKLLVQAHGVVAEQALRSLLRAPTREARGAAVRALGRVGTLESVQVLRAALDDPNYPIESSTVIVAIERIKKRLPSAAPGQLSFVPKNHGELSLIEPRSDDANPPSA
ncbi:MAG: HEAT repeat domain-containing protein, partial [Myxococcota bacterium]